MSRLTPALAAQFMTLTLGHLGRQYPYKPDLVINGPEDIKPPVEHHPIFHGSFDWHSCVHGWWQVMRLGRLFPDMADTVDVHKRADALFCEVNVLIEKDYFSRPNRATASRPYGWAWLLALHSEMGRHEAPWAAALEPLARDLAARFGSYLTKLTYPIRVGTHFNSSFACILAHEWGNTHHPALAALIETRARDWFGDDRDCQAWEPGGDDFLSSALTEALLMSRVLHREEFVDWFAAFLPRAAQCDPATLFTPAHVSDRSDGKIAHLDGLNLSRAWCWKGIAAALAPHRLEALAQATAETHIAAALPHIASDYMGEHWLATYALLALEAG